MVDIRFDPVKLCTFERLSLKGSSFITQREVVMGLTGVAHLRWTQVQIYIHNAQSTSMTQLSHKFLFNTPGEKRFLNKKKRLFCFVRRGKEERRVDGRVSRNLTTQTVWAESTQIVFHCHLTHSFRPVCFSPLLQNRCSLPHEVI